MSQDKYTKAARGMHCQVRYPGVCNHNPETVVAAHYRLAGLCGTGIKPHNLIAAHACSACHDLVDQRTALIGTMSRDSIRLAHAEGVMRTIDLLIRKGFLKT